MMLDFHYHIARGALRHSMSAVIPCGCILSQRESDNVDCLQIATRNEMACGLFAHPRGSDWRRIVRLVSRGKALAYQHLELLEKSDLKLLDPLLVISQEQGVPVILHLSRHDSRVFSEPEAVRCLDYVLQRFPDLRIIVSHCGGENVLAVVKTAKNCPRILLDTSRIKETSERSYHKAPISLLDRIANELPAKQLLYGSDQSWPRYTHNPTELNCLSKVFQPADLKDICLRNGTAILKSLRAPSMQ
jgi:predicted TIM-barrel fold metal-dependent hydrolase